MVLKMKRKVRDDLIARLRSGAYLQGNMRLRSLVEGEERFCCLGVLCEMAVEAGVIEPSEEYEDLYINRRAYMYDGKWSATLPDKVIAWAGVVSEYDERIDPPSGDLANEEGSGRFEIASTRLHSSLAEMNDSGVTFEQIAEYLEDEVVPL